MIKATGNEVVLSYGQYMLDIAPSNRCIVCYTRLNDCGHNRGMACGDDCHELFIKIVEMMGQIGDNIMLDFHKYNQQIAEKRWKGMQ